MSLFTELIALVATECRNRAGDSPAHDPMDDDVCALLDAADALDDLYDILTDDESSS